MAIINNLLILTGVPVYWQGLVAGLVLIVAVGFDEYSKRRRGEIRS
jgi:ABC-type xylose transport system permease subunit